MPGHKAFGTEVLTAADVNGYLMRQTVMRYTTPAAIIAGIPTPEPGMIAYASSTGYHYIFDGTTWHPVLQRTARTPITFLTGYKAFDAILYPVTVSSLNGVGRLSGLLDKTSGTFAASSSQAVATIPAGFRPAFNVYAAAMVPPGAGNAQIRIEPSGSVTVYGGTTTAAYVGLDSITWQIAT